MKRNALQLIGSFHQGGSERQAVQLTRLLHEDQNYRIFAATLDKNGVLLGEIEKLGLSEIPEFKLTSLYNLNFIRQLRKCVQFIRENEIDIVHTHDFYTNIFGILAARIAGVKLKIASKRETAQMRSRAQKLIERFVFSMSDAIVANSAAVKQYLTGDGIPQDKIKMIWNGLDLKRLTIREPSRTKICETLCLPIDDRIKFITLVANLRHTVKNQSMFLRAARNVLEDFPDAHFVIAGEGELKTDLENLTKELQIEKNMHFVGRCAIIPELLSISYIGVLTSFAEGFSNSILEYMAAGLPVVATRVGGAAEAIVDGETGFLVESDDDKTMAKCLAELLADEDKATRFGEKGRSIVEEKFSLEGQLRKTLELYAY
ncbi:MAG: glycosyltransferase [Saprospiraceae bacterium]|nr:glycosyltransferase [Pyrinomonadaceae bacterium]